MEEEGEKGASANKNEETNATYKPAITRPLIDKSTTEPNFSLERGDPREAGHLAKRSGRITLNRALHKMANVTGQDSKRKTCPQSKR